MVYNATFNNISVISVAVSLLVEETRETTDLSVAIHWQTLSHNSVSIEYTSHEWDSNSQR